MRFEIRSAALGIWLIAFVFKGHAQSFGERLELPDWHFHLGDVRFGGTDSLDHTSWEKVRVPHDWSVLQLADSTLSSCTGYLPGGVGWYRTVVNIPHDDLKRFLFFEGVYRNSEVYVNGSWVGYRPNGYVSFMYDITPYLKKGTENVIAVKVDHSEQADSRWYTGSGIYRKAYLVTANPIHIDQWGIRAITKVENEKEASVEVHSTVKNETIRDSRITISHELLDYQGVVKAVAESAVAIQPMDQVEVVQTLQVSNIRLWNLDNPHLYTLRTIISDETGQVLDKANTLVGIRTLSFHAEKGFALNGDWMKIKGVCLHHDAGVLGSAVPKEVWRERLLTLKEIGVNGIRMSHNPQVTDLYDLCDELGFLVMDEAFDEWEYPKKKWIEGWNVGEPGFQGYAPFFREWGKRDLASMVKSNRNHPSIIMWSIGNEVDFPNDPYSHPILESEGIDQIHSAGYLPGQPHAERLGDIALELAAVVRAIDPSRPVTAALAGAVMSNETGYPGALDVVGYNYTESRYQADHEKYPERILYGSETRHNIEAWQAVAENDFIFGQFLWTGIDYLGEAGPWPARGSSAGLLDLTGNIKPRGYFRKSLWTNEPMIYMGTYPVPERNRSYLSIDAPHVWDYESGQPVRVVAYTNCAEAEVLLNGKSIGSRQKYDASTGIMYWDVPFSPGKLEVRAYGQSGNVLMGDFIKTSGVPKKISTRIRGNEPSESNDVLMIEVEVQDSNGNKVNNANNLITCRIDGPGRLLGLENASSNVTEYYRTNSLKCKNGRLLVYIQSEADTGVIKILFDSPGLKSDQITINME